MARPGSAQAQASPALVPGVWPGLVLAAVWVLFYVAFFLPLKIKIT